jgi:hypothetical protein
MGIAPINIHKFVRYLNVSIFWSILLLQGELGELPNILH